MLSLLGGVLRFALRFHCQMHGPGQLAAMKAKQRNGPGFGRRLDNHRIESIKAAADVVARGKNGFDLGHFGVLRRGGLEIQLSREALTLSFKFTQQRLTAGIKVLPHAGDLDSVSFVGTALEAWRQAHLHLRINAAGKTGIGIQVKGAAAHLEQVKRIIEKLVCHGPRTKRAIIERAAAQFADACGDIGARIFVFQVEADHRRGPQTQALLVCLRKLLPQGLIEQQHGLKV